MLLTTISPAPRSSPRRTQSSASSPVASRAPSMNTSEPCPDADVLHLGAEHHALVTERACSVADDVRVADGHRVDADLLRARLEHLEHVVDVADATADGERDEHVVGDAAHGVEIDL